MDGLNEMPFAGEEDEVVKEEFSKKKACDGGKEEIDEGVYISWKPYVELLSFIKDYKNQRMSYFYLTDSIEGGIIEKQISISIQEWTEKFKVLKALPYDAQPKTSIATFKAIAKGNDLIPILQKFLQETKDAIVLDKDKEVAPGAAEVTDKDKEVAPGAAEHELSKLIALWE